MIKQIGLPLRGRLILLITCKITDRIGLHSAQLPLLLIIILLFTLGSIYSTYASGAKRMTETNNLNQT